MSFQPIAALILLAAFAVCFANIGETPRHYCGRNIGIALDLICYTEEDKEKRSGNNRDLSMYSNNMIPSFWGDVESGDLWPWIAPHKAKSISAVGRTKRLIVDECCRKPCTRNELKNYCEP